MDVSKSGKRLYKWNMWWNEEVFGIWSVYDGV